MRQLALFLIAVFILQIIAQENIVETKFGTVRGGIAQQAREFLGIPFAAPPVGQLRWKPPQDPKPWPGILETTTWSAGCPQKCALPPDVCPDKISEDCLYLNVYTPRLDRMKAPLPVMLFIPGGAYEQGAAGVGLYDSKWFTNQTEVIIVTTNYRLGALGFLKTRGINGNFGMLDQIKALRWVKDNIAAFGGDPNLVTVYGESAGAISVASLLVSPAAEGLFDRAILQSNPFSLQLKNLSLAIMFGNVFTERAGCTVDDLNCLMSLSVDQIIDAQAHVDGLIFPTHIFGVFMPWGPVASTYEMPVQPFEALAAGEIHNKVPILMGTLSQEGIMFIYEASSSALPLYAFDGALLALFGLKNFPAVSAQYPVPLAQTNDARPVLGQMGTDYIFTCANRVVARGLSNAGIPVYHYYFDHVLSFTGAWGENFTFCYNAVCHGAELAVLFNAAHEFFNPTAAEEDLALQMAQYWASFARTGTPNDWVNPNDQTLPPRVDWPRYNAVEDNALYFATPSNSVKYNIRKDKCDFWDSMGYQFSN